MMVLSDRMWRSRFSGDPAIVGRVVPFDDSPYTVVGVMPLAFSYGEADFWRVIVRKGLVVAHGWPRRHRSICGE